MTPEAKAYKMALIEDAMDKAIGDFGGSEYESSAQYINVKAYLEPLSMLTDEQWQAQYDSRARLHERRVDIQRQDWVTELNELKEELNSFEADTDAYLLKRYGEKYQALAVIDMAASPSLKENLESEIKVLQRLIDNIAGGVL